MEVRAVTRGVRLSPKKARLVVDHIRGQDVNQALRWLRFANVKAAKPVRKTLESAIANAENNHDMDVDRLLIVAAYVDAGPTLKRLKPRAMGRANLIRRRSSDITIVVSEASEAQDRE
ncbi:MAG: 50S ribosomal protein L22 [Candidatus Bipolaricaulia bacterium]